MRGDDFRRFTTGTAAEVRAVVEAHTPRLLAIARGHGLPPDDAEDAVQATWVRAYERRATLRDPAAFGPWLAEICRNRCRNELRRDARRAAADEAESLPSRDRPDEGAALLRDLMEALAALPERQREAAYLRLVERRSTRETAARLNCAEGTVKAALHAALRKLREELHAWRD